MPKSFFRFWEARNGSSRPHELGTRMIKRPMKFPLTLSRSLVPRDISVASTMLLVLFAVGCASPRPPHPPTLNLPETVKDLTAERVGDVVRLHWTTPTNTTDKAAVKGAMTAEICRTTVTPSPQAPVCTSVKRLPVVPGLSQTSDTLPFSLTADPASLLAYRVQILNAHGHSAGPSPEAFAATGAAPPAVEQLRATPSREGAMLEWKQQNTSAAVELDRLPVGPNGEVIEPPPPKPASTKSSSRPGGKKPAETAKKPAPAPASQPKSLLAAPPAPIEVKLRAKAEPADAGGTIDSTATTGQTFRYTAQRVRSVTLDGHSLELRSSISSPVTVVMKDIFPPQAPSGLEAVPGGANASDRSIDLSWTPNSDTDLAGYFVYRQEIDLNGAATGTVTRLNTTPVVGPAYRDQTAMAGRRYAYHVTAVDTAGNESVPSAQVQETLREQ
jgi:fibronectin type 3 domain-containing protein